ncbi:MAG: hypothetical protein LBC84_07515 [Prevotellaceae bacterium]|nr:hypothetical protein [Prevotellaceae bacterium]
MMKLSVFLLILLLHLSTAAQNSGQRQKDSLRNVISHSEGVERLDTYARLLDYYFREMGDKEKRDTLFALSPDYLAFAAERESWDMYYQIYRSFISAYWNKGDNVTALDLAKEMYEEAKLRGHNSAVV